MQAVSTRLRIEGWRQAIELFIRVKRWARGDVEALTSTVVFVDVIVVKARRMVMLIHVGIEVRPSCGELLWRHA